jgi:hypothetical protein
VKYAFLPELLLATRLLVPGVGMHKLLIAWFCLAFALAGPCFSLSAQEGAKGKEKGDDMAPLPNDPELLNLHREFVQKAEKLAVKYEKEKQWSNAKDCYQEILKLVPQYPPAKQKVQELLQLEAGAYNHSVVLRANEKWKDTGVTVIEGRPITIRATGTWTFTLTADVSADGLKIPEELREFDPGCLVGMIIPPDVQDRKEIKPFMIGSEKQFIPPKSGSLLVQMYDNDMRDNSGELTLEIQGTFHAEGLKTKTKPKGKQKNN